MIQKNRRTPPLFFQLFGSALRLWYKMTRTMKNILLLILFIACFSCKDKYLTPEIVQPLVGKWRVVAVEPVGKNEWQYVTQNREYEFEIRYDGVVLWPNGLPACCAPNKLNINGKTFKIEPQSRLPENPQCSLVNCVYCETWYMDLQDDVLTIRYCNGGVGRARYTKI